MRLLLFQLMLILISHSEGAADGEQQSSLVAVATAKACPGCGGIDCTNTTFAFGIPILQVIGGVVAGLIWAAIFIWIYVWVDKGPYSGNGGGGFGNNGGGGFGNNGGGGFGNRNDDIQGIPPQAYDVNTYATDYQSLPTADTYAYRKTKRGGKVRKQNGGPALPISANLENPSEIVAKSIPSTF